MFYYHFKDKYDLVAWMFCTDAYGKDITSITSAAAGMNYSSKAAPGYHGSKHDPCLCKWHSG